MGQGCIPGTAPLDPLPNLTHPTILTFAVAIHQLVFDTVPAFASLPNQSPVHDTCSPTNPVQQPRTPSPSSTTLVPSLYGTSEQEQLSQSSVCQHLPQGPHPQAVRSSSANAPQERSSEPAPRVSDPVSLHPAPDEHPDPASAHASSCPTDKHGPDHTGRTSGSGCMLEDLLVEQLRINDDLHDTARPVPTLASDQSPAAASAQPASALH
eukprot:gene7334-6894_t